MSQNFPADGVRRRKLMLLVLPILAFLVVSTGCGQDRVAGGTGAGNPDASIALRILATTKTVAAARTALVPVDTGLVLRDSGGLEFRPNRVRAWVDRIEVDLPGNAQCPDSKGSDSCEVGTLWRDQGRVWDLVRGVPDSLQTPFLLPSGTYRTLRIRFDKPGGSDVSKSDCLSGRSFCLEGTFLRLGVVRPFRLQVALQQKLVFADSTGISIAPGSSRLSALLGIGKWLSSLDVGNCLDGGSLPAGTDTLVIDRDFPCGNFEDGLNMQFGQSQDLQGD